jgi:hypothetical protein
MLAQQLFAQFCDDIGSIARCRCGVTIHVPGPVVGKRPCTVQSDARLDPLPNIERIAESRFEDDRGRAHALDMYAMMWRGSRFVRQFGCR